MFVFPSRLLKFVSAAAAFVMLLGVLLLPAPAANAGPTGLMGEITDVYRRVGGCTLYIVYQAYEPFFSWPEDYEVRIYGGTSNHVPLATFIATKPGRYVVAVKITQLYPNGGTIFLDEDFLANMVDSYDLDTAISLADRRRCAALQP